MGCFVFMSDGPGSVRDVDVAKFGIASNARCGHIAG